MKQLFLLFAFVNCTLLFAQKLEYNEGKIFQDGEQLSSFETKNLLKYLPPTTVNISPLSMC